MAGSGRYGVLGLGVTWIRHDPRKRPCTTPPEKWNREHCELRLGALTSGYQEAWEKIPLKEGDEITIRILGPGSSDVPPKRYRSRQGKTKLD